MPYISRKRQLDLDPLISNLITELKENEMGDLEYVFFTILNAYCQDPHTRKFTQMNSLVGVLETTKAEFIRRVLGPYEDLKLIDNWAEGIPED